MIGGGGDENCERDPFDGSERSEGFEAEQELANEARRAKHRSEGSVDPLDGLAERIKAEKRSELAFDSAVLSSALDLRTEEIAAFQALRRELKAAGVPVLQWEDALDTLEKKRRDKAKAEEAKRLANKLNAKKSAREREAEEAALAREQARAEAPDELRAHFPEPVTVNACTYAMAPGQTWCDRQKGSGDAAVTVTEELADFSARITAHVSEVLSPGASPHNVLELSLHVRGESSPRVVHVPSEEFRRMDWVESRAPGAVVIETGRREHLRIAIEKLSPPTSRARRFCYRSSGWFPSESSPIYVTSGASFGVSGIVDGVRAEPFNAGDKLGLFALPSTAGSDRVADLKALRKLLDIEPAHVALPCLGLSFRSVMGGNPGAVHIWGESRVGKSRLASMFWRLFGPAMHFKNPPASWFNDSPATILSRMARVGNAVLGVSDMQPDTPGQTVDVVFRSLFNNATPGRMKREGGEREGSPLRASILSDGERGVRGPSLPSRVASVFLDRRFTPDPDGEGGLEALASSGALARGMARFVESYAPRYAENLPRLGAMERENAARWDLKLTDRDAEVYFPLALGIEALLRVLRSAEVLTAEELDAQRRRAAEALRVAASASRAGADEQRPGVVALRAIGAAIRSCSNDGAHVGATRLNKGKRERSAPPYPERWGYTIRAGTGATPMGSRVGVRRWEDPSEIVLDLGVALSVAKRWAPRICGVELPVGTTRELLEAFRALDRTAKREKGRPEGKTRITTGDLGSSSRLDGWAASPEDLGIDTTDDPPPEEGADTGADNPADDVVPFGSYGGV